MLEGKQPPGERVVVYDAEGYFTAPGLAEKLAGEGFAVELVTCLERIAPVCDETLEGALLRQHLHASACASGRGRRADRHRARAPERRPTSSARRSSSRPTPSCSARSGCRTKRSTCELKAEEEALDAEGIEALYRIGDCVAPRIIAEAIFDGHRLAREIDSENPAVPLPYKRERILLGSTVAP